MEGRIVAGLLRDRRQHPRLPAPPYVSSSTLLLFFSALAIAASISTLLSRSSETPGVLTPARGHR